MTLSTFFGCTFIAFGPALALFLFTVAKEPLRVIILVAGAFFWLVSLLFSSLVWFIAVKASNGDNDKLQHGLLIFGVLLSVIFQETFRYGYYRLLRKAQEGLVSLSEDGCSPVSMKQMAYVAGLGFGIMSGAFSVVNILAESIGPGTIGIHGDSPYFFLTSAFMTLAVILLHLCWGVIYFDSCDKGCWFFVLLIVISHLIVSCLTFANPHYEGSLIPTYGILFGMAVWAFFTGGGTTRTFVRFLGSCFTKAQSPSNHSEN
uniref:gamma-secretase subunit Aph-1b-like isoform X1 n=1 Tax=Myxine glutinosa TaxID=7769 RepID=UPI00358E80B2